ncbi:long-chain-acyl-CoA synthetase [Algibacter mikhailovii]|uniref:long-chain-acyl-CoA synthetase n=1 Tax=Algibacter mikhailovii TaxID=425498 RepID=UPI00249594CE|nr:long-chain-acyl-CoA synthetase [Algibacter mikhailovii]
MTKPPNKHTIKLSQILGKLVLLTPQLPRIIKYIKKAKNLHSDSNESIGKIIESIAAKQGDTIALRYEDDSYTYNEFNTKVNKYANYLISEGVKNGDTVIAFLENRPELLFLITACAKIGAIVSLINPNQREKVLIHSLELTKSRFYFIGEELIPYFEKVKPLLTTPEDNRYYWIADKKLNDCPKHYVNLNEVLINTNEKNPVLNQPIKAGQVYAYVFTSGTTGLPKASRQTHRKWLSTHYWFGKVNMNLNQNDVMYIPIPFYHTNALIVGWPTALAAQCTVVMRRKFSVSQFWEDVKKYNVSSFIYIGELCRYLVNAPPSKLDKTHRIKKIMGNGLRPDIWHEFKERFQIKHIFEFYGAADGNVGFTNTFNFDCTIGWCPTNYSIIKYDIENDCPIKGADNFLIPVHKGETGLLISEISETMAFDGYVNKTKNKDKILQDVFKKGDHWFNSGDLLQDIGFKHARFVDRLGDTFRWKGENVATDEVEGVLGQLESIDMCAVYGVQIPNNDGKAGMATITTHSDKDFNINTLTEHLLNELPRYAVPIFIRLKDQISFTHTLKIKKFDLKKEGFNCDDTIYVMLPKTNEYTILDEKLLKDINSGHYTF